MNPHRLHLQLAALLASAFLLLPSAVAPAAAEVIPIVITNIVVQKIGPEAELEPLEEGLLYWRPADATTDAGLYYADGETPGGVAVCVGKADYHTLTNDLACNGHALKLNAHYSLRAEGDSCLLRYGTNIVLRVDGNREAGSTNSLIKATVLSADNEGLTIQANALASDGATIEVTTDLMAVESWTPATNAVVTDTTDVSTTWRITYLDEPYQFYRVFAGSSTPHGTGITAERPFTASQGLAIPEGQPLTMGDTTWTNLPDMSTYASNSAVAAVRADLASLSWRTTTAEGAIDANAAGIAAVQGAVATNAGNIATNSTRIAAIESDYVQSSDIADFATTGAVASVERRIDALEYPETCCLFWPSSYVASNMDVTTSVMPVPTNFPTQRLSLVVDDTDIPYLNIEMPRWAPNRKTVVDIFPCRNNSATNRNTRVRIGGESFAVITTSAHYRRFRMEYDPGSCCWQSESYQLTTTPYWYDAAGRKSFPTNRPATVEAWLTLHPEWSDPTPPSLLSSPSLRTLRPLSSPASFEPDDFTDDPAALADLAPEDFPEDLDDFADAPADAPPAEE